MLSTQLKYTLMNNYQIKLNKSGINNKMNIKTNWISA